MANDIDMWNDIEHLEKSKSKKNKAIAKDLLKCYSARYINFDELIAEKCKNDFHRKWKFWGNYY